MTVMLDRRTRTRTTIALGAALLLGAAVWGASQVSRREAGQDVAALLTTLPSKGATASDSAVHKEAARLRADPKDSGAWARFGDALMQKARESGDGGYYGRAERAFRKALELNEKNVTAVIGLAWVTSATHEFEKSIEWANRAIALDPKRPEPYGLLGDAAVEMGDYEEAFDQYQSMLDRRPDLASYSRGAHLLYLTGNTRKAAWLMEKAIAAGGPYAENTAWCRAELAKMLWENGALLPAERVVKAGLKATPRNRHLLAMMGHIRASRRDYAGAITQLKKSVEIAPEHDTLVALGDLYALTGRRDDAEAQYRAVEALHELHRSQGIRGDAKMALFYADQGRKLPEALRLAEEEWKIRKNVAVADALAWTLHKNGRHEEAWKAMRRALAHNTPNARFLYHAGMIRAALGDKAGAQQYLYRALNLNPNFHPRSAKLAADTLKRLGAQPEGGARVAAR
jgi:tetratricopeptide (TPR) repeat protein